jgi:hypothetical protein
MMETLQNSHQLSAISGQLRPIDFCFFAER